jgi:2-polyprenyl-6-methoxyphenol hydroxylase-like FAD-dependent oxidoreductase
MSRISSKGRVAVVGAGPGGMATALALGRLGFDVTLYERSDEVRAEGNILNLWPPPQKVLEVIGVDISDLGAACHLELRRADGRPRADIKLPDKVVRDYGGGFIGLLRWGLYKRMLDALPAGVLRLGHEVTSMQDHGDRVMLSFANGDEAEADVVVGADGLNSTVRSWLWGREPVRHQRLHVVAGWLYVDGAVPTLGVAAHNRTTQGSYTPIRHEGRGGYEWWVLEAFDPSRPFKHDLLEFARERAIGFAEPLPTLIEGTSPEHMQRWVIRDRKPLKQWSKGRVTLVGDAAHPTSPYAAYGAGMSIEDGYFLARELDAVDVRDASAVSTALQAFEDRRKPHTAKVSQQAYYTGLVLHRLPRPVRPIRDFLYDHTSLLQKTLGDPLPGQILTQLEEIEAPGPRVPAGP